MLLTHIQDGGKGRQNGFPPARQSATPMTLTCRTPSDTKTSLGSWEAPLRSTPRIEPTCSGALKNTRILDKRMRGTKGLGVMTYGKQTTSAVHAFLHKGEECIDLPDPCLGCLPQGLERTVCSGRRRPREEPEACSQNKTREPAPTHSHRLFPGTLGCCPRVRGGGPRES